MATFTIKIESNELARDFLTHMGYIQEDDIPDLISDVDSTEEPQSAVIEESGDTEDTAESKERVLTTSDVLEFLRAKGSTLEEACKNDQELGDFFAIFTVKPEKRIEGELEPAGGKSIGAELDYEQETFDVQNACYVQASKEREVFMMNEDEIRENAMAVKDDMARFQYLIGMTDCESRIKRDAAHKLVFEFLANRDLDPTLIAELSAKNVKFLHKLYEYKETQFLFMFKKENGV
jgi:hypothetical protein